MLKDASYKEKFTLLEPCLAQLFSPIKSDLKNDHLRQDPNFAKKYFGSKNLNKLTPEELSEGYLKAIQNEENTDEIADFLFNRWLLKNSEIYNFFEDSLRAITPNFTDLTEIDTPVGTKIMENAVSQFGATRTFLFSVINSVVFSKPVYDALSKKAQQESKEKQERTQQVAPTLEGLQKAHEQEMNRVIDKYEKKMQGLQKKYIQDTESLKKQLATLQKKLHAHAQQ